MNNIFNLLKPKKTRSPRKPKHSEKDMAIINLFEQHHPSSLDEAKNLGLELTFVAKGVAREAYRLGDNLLVKFEYSPEDQTAKEIRVIKKVYTNKEFKDLRKHIPPVYYGNEKNKVIIIKYYEKKLNYPARYNHRELADELRTRLKVTDMHENNFRVDEKGNLIAIDLGWS